MRPCEAAQIHAHKCANAIKLSFARPILLSRNDMQHTMSDSISQPCQHIGGQTHWCTAEKPPHLAGEALRDSSLMGSRRVIRDASQMCPAVRRHAREYVELDGAEGQESRVE